VADWEDQAEVSKGPSSSIFNSA